MSATVTSTPPAVRVLDSARVRVRLDPAGNVVQAIGIAGCQGPSNAFLSLRVQDSEQAEQGYMLLRLGAGPAMFLLRRLTEICRQAWPAEVLAEATPRAVAPGPRDDTYVPGEPWRRGRWVEPMKRGPHA